MICVRAFGQQPSVRRLFVGFLSAVFISLLLVSLTTVLNREGNSSRLPLFLLLCAWSILSCFRTAKRTVLAMAGLFVYFLALSFQHLYLANSSGYTDNPQARLRSIAAANRSRAKQHKPIFP